MVEPRTLKLADGTTTDGVSGEMLKHVHAAYIWALQANKSKFCPACRVLEPMRAEWNPHVTDAGNNNVKTATDQALRDCILCDLHGFLVQRPTVHRDSTVQFGWAVGLREQVYRDIHQHARHAVGERGREEPQPMSEEAPQAETGETAQVPKAARPITAQMLYSRPTRSGIYALVSLFQPWRIGLNTITYQYPEGLDRQERYQLALQAYQTMFWRTDGAMTTTRLPHLEAFEGVLVIARQNIPVPVVSPLKDKYQAEIEDLAKASDNAFEYKLFNDLTGFVKELRQLEGDQPYTLSMPA